MKFETENPGLVKLFGVVVAVVCVVIGAEVAPALLPYMTTMAGVALGAVGIQVSGKSQQ